LADHIANTSPLCYLHRAGILHILPAILGRVIVPGQVVAELGAGRARLVGELMSDCHNAFTALRQLRLPKLRTFQNVQLKAEIERLKERMGYYSTLPRDGLCGYSRRILDCTDEAL